MRIQASNKNLYDILPTGKPVEERIKCPACSHTHSRGKENKKDLGWNNNHNRGYCHRCQESFFEYRPHSEQKEYFVPAWENKTDLTDKAVKYWTGRMISQNTLNKCKIYSDTQFMPQHNKEVEVIAFPYFRESKLINAKYRGPGKAMKMIKGAELLFLNEDSLRDNKEIIIVEGEPDYLTFVENGFDNVISTPNGANHKQMEYFEKVSDLFNEIETVYIAVDNDTEGIKLRDELIRRIGADKCRVINFKECKDANDYFLKYGPDFKDLIKDAKEVAIEGTIEVNSMYSDLVTFFEKGIQPGLTINEPEIDKWVTWELGRLAIVTGTPGSGKSEIVDFIISKLNLLHGWKCAYYTPENYPLKYHYSKLFEKFIGRRFAQTKSSEIDFDMAYEHIKDNFFYIMDEYDMKLEQILTGAEHFVKKKGINILVVDPYNRIEHERQPGERDDLYVNRFLNRLDRFAKVNNLLVFLVAHPITMRDKDVPSLYDISGGSNFFNKAEYGFTVAREKDEKRLMTNEVTIYWQKIKFKHLGSQGVSEMRYNYNNGRLQTRTESVDMWDNSSWLVPTKEEDIFIKPSQSLRCGVGYIIFLVFGGYVL